jgi:RNA polymerase sigma-70 factor (ECF subfamily)
MVGVAQGMNDEELFERVISGCQPAMEELVARYYAPLRGYFYHLVGGNLQDSEDLVQETFLRVLRYKGKKPYRFRLWVYTVARNLAYDRFRSASYKHEQVGDKTDLLEEGDGYSYIHGVDTHHRLPEAKVIEMGSAEAVREELHRLPALQREVIIMRFYGEMKLEEIATITGYPLGTVKSRLFKGLQHYKKILEEVENGNE